MLDFPPVSVEIRPGSFKTVRTVQQATELVLSWPQGRRRLAALKACLASLEGAEKPDDETSRRVAVSSPLPDYCRETDP